MTFSVPLVNRKQFASLEIASMMLTIASLWLILAAGTTSAYAQVADEVSHANSTANVTPSPADWTMFLRDI